MERIDEYVAWLAGHGGDLSGLRFAVDCSDGSAGILAKRLFPDAVVINDVPDGTFPHHSPNPLKAEAREQIGRAHVWNSSHHQVSRMPSSA